MRVLYALRMRQISRRQSGGDQPVFELDVVAACEVHGKAAHREQSRTGGNVRLLP
jgi:hypothetical protein